MSSVDRTDMGASGPASAVARAEAGGSPLPSVIARGRNLQDPGHGANGTHGLVRAHAEPVNPFGLSPCSPARNCGCRLCQDVALLTQAMVLTSKALPVPAAQRLSAHQCACRRPGRLASLQVEIDCSGSARTSRANSSGVRPDRTRSTHLSPELRRRPQRGIRHLKNQRRSEVRIPSASTRKSRVNGGGLVIPENPATSYGRYGRQSPSRKFRHVQSR